MIFVYYFIDPFLTLRQSKALGLKSMVLNIAE